MSNPEFKKQLEILNRIRKYPMTANEKQTVSTDCPYLTMEVLKSGPFMSGSKKVAVGYYEGYELTYNWQTLSWIDLLNDEGAIYTLYPSIKYEKEDLDTEFPSLLIEGVNYFLSEHRK